jgi:hypothetical protein
MPLTRRAAISLALSALATPGLIRPALAAGCVYPDLSMGIVFKRQDGSRGLARREADGLVTIDYVTNRGAWLDRRRVTHGVFEVSRIVEESEEPMVGASAPSFTWTHSPKVIWPEDGAIWTGKIRELREVTISDENATVERARRRWTATYVCSDPRDVTLSGCSFRALTVEASFASDGGRRSQRWAYFPELSLGIETRRDGITNGLVALGPA